MHELWLCKSILEIIEHKANEQKRTRVKEIILEVGELAAIEKDSLLFSFQIIAAGTVAENAMLQLINIPGQALCESCNKNVPLQHYYEACPDCGGHALRVIQGEELRVKSMVVE